MCCAEHKHTARALQADWVSDRQMVEEKEAELPCDMVELYRYRTVSSCSGTQA